MGWTFIETKTLTTKEKKNYCDKLWNSNCRVLRSSMRGSVYYAAIQKEDNTVFGVVVLTAQHHGEFGYKVIDETMGPNESRCPMSIIKLLTDIDSQYALNWRERCKKNAEQSHNRVSSFPVGAVVTLNLPSTFTPLNGNVTAEKVEKMGKKFWLVNNACRISAKYVNEFAVLNE